MIQWSLHRTVQPDAMLQVTDVLQHLRVVAEVEHTTIEGYLRAAEAEIENECSKAFLTQRWTLRLEAFPCYTIGLPRPTVGHGASLGSVVSITYKDTEGDDQVLSSSLYEVDLYGQPVGTVRPAYGAAWPAVRCEPGSVRIVYEVGHADPAEVPQEVKQAITLLTGDLYLHREETLTGTIVNKLPQLDRLLMNHRCVWEPRYA